MLLLELRVLPLEHLELSDLSRGSGRWRFVGSSSQAAVLHVLPPLRDHEGMNLERGSDGLHLNPGLLTQVNGGELKLVGIPSDVTRSRSRHDPSSLGESVHETGATSPVSCSVRYAAFAKGREVR